MSDETNKAKSIIKGETMLPDLTDEKALKDFKVFIKKLKAGFEFSSARQVLLKADGQKTGIVWITQQLSLCTYKDEELVPPKKFTDALSLLESIGLRDPEKAIAEKRTEEKDLPETFGLGGAVCKRMWGYSGQIDYLYQSKVFYLSAWERSPEVDMGYGGVNAAYVLDVLAHRLRINAKRNGMKSEEANLLGERARVLRTAMAEKLPVFAKDKESDVTREYWYVVTMAEVYYGLKKYEAAGEWLTKAKDLKPAEWERKTTAEQLISLARLQGHTPPKEGTSVQTWHPAWQALYDFLEGDTEGAFSCYRGKVGLALSGGGFRASLYHAGVLARLAEMDVLRSVEVLSTVSGGSIIGALYYLEVQNELQTKQDCTITRADYIKIVKRVQQQLLAGIQKDLRKQALLDFRSLMRMMFSMTYSRSHRMGELYEQELYSRIGCTGGASPRKTPRIMNELLINPKGASPGTPFNPEVSNWTRKAKAPVLLINTASLNSGHSWHFTASWMGEPPGLVGAELGANPRYRRLYYEEAPTNELKNFRLGYAVSASSCVPGLFKTMVLEGLYPGRTVKLVDGGVHDNQGVEGLLNEGCSLILCSDASGQMEDRERPSGRMDKVLFRSNNILMAQVREEKYQSLQTRLDSGALNGLFFVHLKKDIEQMPIDWINCQNPAVIPKGTSCTTPYGVDKDLQKKLSAVRTDLDSFSEIEAYSLMLSGYLMTEYEFRELDKKHKADEEDGEDGEIGHWGDFDPEAPREEWDFLELESLMRQSPDSSDVRRKELGKHLDASSASFFRKWFFDIKATESGKIDRLMKLK